MISRNYFSLIFGFGLRSITLTLLVVILARAMGSNLYGGYAAAISLAGLCATFSGLGAASLHVRDVTRGRQNHGSSLLLATSRILHTIIPLAVFCVAIGWLLIPHTIPVIDIMMISLGELTAVTATDTAFRAMQARERYFSMAFVLSGMPIIRLTAALIIWLAGSLVFTTWAWVSFLTGSLALIAVILSARYIAKRQPGSNRPLQRITGSDALSGIGYSLAAASARIHGDADKVVIARLAGTSVAGQYAMAYRLTDALTLPIVAAVEYLLPSLFRQGKDGFVTSLRRLLPGITVGLVGASVLSALVYYLAPILPWLLGSSYVESIKMARALSLVPLSMTIWYMTRTVAGTSGYEKAMGVTELAGAAFNVIACIAAVTVYGWLGAVYATYATHLLMSVTLLAWGFLREPEQPKSTAA